MRRILDEADLDVGEVDDMELHAQGLGGLPGRRGGEERG